MEQNSQLAPDEESSWVLPAVLIVALIVVGLMLATYSRDHAGTDARGRFGNEIGRDVSPAESQMGLSERGGSQSGRKERVGPAPIGPLP